MIIVPSTPISLNLGVFQGKWEVMKHPSNMCFSIVNDFLKVIFLIIFYFLSSCIIDLFCKKLSSWNHQFWQNFNILLDLRKFIHPYITNIDRNLPLCVKMLLLFRNIKGFICTAIHVITALSLIELSFIFFFSLWPSSSIEKLWPFIFL